MRVLLRKADTGLFYAGPNRWTEDVAAAHDFRETTLAMDAANQTDVSTVEVLMHFDNPAFEIPLRIVGNGV